MTEIKKEKRAELVFTYGTMGSAKTAEALIKVHNLKNRGHTASLIKVQPGEYNPDDNMIKSRAGIEAEAFVFNTSSPMLRKVIQFPPTDYVIIDEAQFLTRSQVDDLAWCVDNLSVNIFAYGLRTDFQGKLFSGSKRLFEIADSIKELQAVCDCGSNATINARFADGRIVTQGKQIVVGGDELYTALCRKCWLTKRGIYY